MAAMTYDLALKSCDYQTQMAADRILINGHTGLSCCLMNNLGRTLALERSPPSFKWLS